MEIFNFLPVLLSCGHLVQLMAATFRRDTKMFADDKTFLPWKNHKSIPQTRSYLKEIEDKGASFEVGLG